MQLPPADVFSRGNIGRATQERGKACDDADIVALRLLGKATQAHVLDLTFAQTAGGG
jgi:hypothetical protein